MRPHVTTPLLLTLSLALVSCDGSDTTNPPKPITTTSTSTGGGGNGGSGGDPTGGGGVAGNGGTGGSSDCGDGIASITEFCDGADLAGQTCQSLGFDSGTLLCKADCTFDTSGCAGVENCQDGLDNDGDGSTDCGDADCTVACANACASPLLVPDPGSVFGNTDGHAPLAQPSSCTDVPAGPAVAYSFTAASTGLLDVTLTNGSNADLAVSIRSLCADAATELGCVNSAIGGGTIEFLSVPIVQNDTVFITVSGSDPAQTGPFELFIQSRQPSCGDAIQDPGEECDDGNATSNDGCSVQCNLEATENEPNDTTGNANPYSAPFFAQINSPGDQDVVSVVLAAPSTSIVATTAAVTSNACTNNMLDSYIDILDPSGTMVLASDDDSGAGLCARATAPGLPPGTYFVRVKAGGPPPTFPYRLDITLVQDMCGDGNITPGEQCDDGNTTAGDGCSPTCQLELSEVEPNNTSAQANPYLSPWLATISPAMDVDVVSVNVPGPSSMLSAQTTDNGTGTCSANLLDSYLEILAPDGTTILKADDDSGAGYCSFASLSGLAAGTYFVRVTATALTPTFFYRLNVNVQ